MKTSISKILGFTDREVRKIFHDEENILLEEREIVEKKPRNQIIIVKSINSSDKRQSDC